MKPNCYDCKHRRSITWDAHSSCANIGAKVRGAAHGIKQGWFLWPINFDPVWLESCDGFKHKNEPEFAYEVIVSIANAPLGADSHVAARTALALCGLQAKQAEVGGNNLAIGFTTARELNEKETEKMKTVFQKTLATIAGYEWAVESIRRKSELLVKQ